MQTRGKKESNAVNVEAHLEARSKAKFNANLPHPPSISRL